MGAGEGERECVNERESPLSLPPHPSLALSLSYTNIATCATCGNVISDKCDFRQILYPFFHQIAGGANYDAGSLKG